MSIRSTLKGNGVVLDSSAWIEYAAGTPRGAKVRDLIGTKSLYVSSYSTVEICAVALRQNQDDERAFRILLGKTIQIHVDAELALNAARMHFVSKKKKPKFSYGDALAYVAADHLGVTLITCDNDFVGMKNVTVVR